MRAWDAVVGAMKEKAERRVLEAFGRNLKMTSIVLPLSIGREDRKAMKEIVGKWNSNHSAKCEYRLIFPICSSES